MNLTVGIVPARGRKEGMNLTVGIVPARLPFVCGESMCMCSFFFFLRAVARSVKVEVEANLAGNTSQSKQAECLQLFPCGGQRKPLVLCDSPRMLVLDLLSGVCLYQVPCTRTIGQVNVGVVGICPVCVPSSGRHHSACRPWQCSSGVWAAGQLGEWACAGVHLGQYFVGCQLSW